MAQSWITQCVQYVAWGVIYIKKAMKCLLSINAKLRDEAETNGVIKNSIVQNNSSAKSCNGTIFHSLDNI